MPPPAPPSRRQAALLRFAMRVTWERGLLGGAQDPPPVDWGARVVRVPRKAGGTLAGVVFDAIDSKKSVRVAPIPSVPLRVNPIGVVIFGHPGIPPAKGYFHRSDRVPFVRALGFAALTFDHGGFGESDAARADGYPAEWADVLAFARARWPGLPLHVWGVSLGGYFAHHALALDEVGVESALFEQVSPNLLRYGRDGLPPSAGERILQRVAPEAAAWLPCIAHAPYVNARRILHVSGTRDHGISPAQAAALVAASPPATRHHAVEGAPHLGAWKEGGAALRAAVAAHLRH